ncbi:MAG: AAA family ATPase [Poseidonibacter sp.]
MNNHIVMSIGKPVTGKTSSLRKLPPERTAYINFDNKPLPFPVPFYKDIRMKNIDHLLGGIDTLENDDNVEYIVLDTISFMMEMYENQKVVTAVNTQQAWGEYAQFYITFLHKIKTSKKKIIVLAHSKDVYNENEMVTEQVVPVKGAIGKRGVEADFTTIIGSKKIKTIDLETKKNDLLSITDEEEEDGFKYIFQTRVTKDTMNEKMRSQLGLWNREELYIDNDIVKVMDRITDYYKGEK